MRAGSIIVTALLAIAAVVQMSAIDIWLSDSVYDFALNHWMIDHSSSIWRPFLYEGPKVLIIAFGLVIIATVARPEWLPLLGFSRREAIFLFLCLAAVPAVVGVVREYSGVSCPRVLQQYGGQIENRFGSDKSSFLVFLTGNRQASAGHPDTPAVDSRCWLSHFSVDQGGRVWRSPHSRLEPVLQWVPTRFFGEHILQVTSLLQCCCRWY